MSPHHGPLQRGVRNFGDGQTQQGLLNVYSEIGNETSQTAAAAVRQSELPRGKAELILVVDDEAAMRHIAQAFLKSYNYQVITDKDGVEAVGLYAQLKEDIKVVLLDMIMPVMSGPETICALEALNPTVKIIAASGLRDEVDRTQQTGSGSVVRAILGKPCTAETLLTTLHEVVQAER
jgi:CheY-like chemotaxis protein